MGTQNRRSVLAGLATILGTVTGVTTVVRSYGDFDVTQYAEVDLPLIVVEEPEEATDEDLTSRRAMMLLDSMLKVWFVDWNDNPQTTYETLMKNIRNKLGSEFLVNQTAVACWVTGIGKIQGQLPVRNFDVEITLRYYLDQQNT